MGLTVTESLGPGAGAGQPALQAPDLSVPADVTNVLDAGESFCRRSSFFVNGEWRNNGMSICGQMYVESLEPAITCHPFPIVLIHGDFHTGQIWQTKPDGNPGWASYFLRHGYHVYLVDLPPSGRSNYLSKPDFANRDAETWYNSLNAPFVEAELTAPEKPCIKLYAQAIFHDKWPGTGRRGDPIFENYFSSLTSLQLNKVERQCLAQNALRTLLKKIGKAVLIGEGTGSIMAWLAADVEPGLVAAIVAVEPVGPPCGSAVVHKSAFRYYDSFIRRDDKVRIYGLADIPLTYDPPLPLHGIDLFGQNPANSPLNLTCQMRKDKQGACLLQEALIDQVEAADLTGQPFQGAQRQGRVRQLMNLKKIPQAVITGQASSHVLFDWATCAFMTQAGVSVEHIRLENLGHYGNGHLMFLETNSDAIAGVIDAWIQKTMVQLPGPKKNGMKRMVKSKPEGPSRPSQVANGGASGLNAVKTGPKPSSYSTIITQTGSQVPMPTSLSFEGQIHDMPNPSMNGNISNERLLSLNSGWAGANNSSQIVANQDTDAQGLGSKQTGENPGAPPLDQNAQSLPTPTVAKRKCSDDQPPPKPLKYMRILGSANKALGGSNSSILNRPHVI